MKKPLTLLLAVIMVVTLLAGCSGGNKNGNGGSTADNENKSGNKNSNTNANAGTEGKTNTAAEDDVYPENGLSKSEKVTLKVGFWENGGGRSWMDTAVKKFSEKYPNVSFDITSTPTLETILEPMIAAGDDEEMFDLFFPRFTAAGQAEKLVEAGKIEPQDDLWNRVLPGETDKTLRSVISDDMFEAVQFKGMTSRVPVGGYTAGLFFDQNLFDEHGWNKNPSTWDEFVALLGDIKAKDIIPITFPGVYAGYLTNYTFDLLPFGLAKGEGNFDTYLDNFRNYTGPQLTTEHNKEEWSRLYDLGKKGYFPPGVAALNHTQSQMQVLQHKAALVSTGDWVGNEMKTSTPEGFKWGFMAIPATNDKDQTIFINSGVTDIGFSIWKNKPDLVKQWSKEFILSLYTFEIQEILAAEAGAFPARLDFGDDPARIAKLQPAPAAVMEYATKHEVQYISFRRNFSLMSPESAQSSKLVSEMITAVASGKKDPLPVLEQAEKLLQKSIEKDRPKK
ncbi:ABC transporter substrate-binding protein [Paenibacillus mendelii]|uniref:ABC transporter substrate-binding protein n=1 Tax=Paenibacillus mendelii TaxID=206163 RepID=A0ABV6J4I3_9BACL|nr:ABC transporter substrate-binding protein [Paenibacillus mendelii]MCQ6561683.1 ABC transporter substrate-binding protein [Paenibacillus mendelii]